MQVNTAQPAQATDAGSIKKEHLLVLKKLSTLPLLSFTLLVEPLLAIAQETQQPSPLQAPHWYWPGPWQFWWICPLMMLFMFLVFSAFFFFGRRSWPEHRHHWRAPWDMMDRTWGSPTDSALQTLNERFARGEIEKDEYEDKKAAILSGGQQ